MCHDEAINKSKIHWQKNSSLFPRVIININEILPSPVERCHFPVSYDAFLPEWLVSHHMYFQGPCHVGGMLARSGSLAWWRVACQMSANDTCPGRQRRPSRKRLLPGFVSQRGNWITIGDKMSKGDIYHHLSLLLSVWRGARRGGRKRRCKIIHPNVLRLKIIYP